jgi:hypothetical protein
VRHELEAASTQLELLAKPWLDQLGPGVVPRAVVEVTGPTVAATRATVDSAA